MEDQVTESDDEFDVDSLFDSASPLEGYFPELGRTCNNHDQCTKFPARKTAPPIPGLFFNPAVLLSEELEEKLISCTTQYFRVNNDNGDGTSNNRALNQGNRSGININQAMLFGRASNGNSGLPPFLDELVVVLAAVLEPHLPMETYEMLFPPKNSTASLSGMSRQAILNHYLPGEGITPHVDLLRRFADGIIGVSLGSGTVMTFQKVEPSGELDRWDVYLPRRSIIVLSKDARYKWTHGIEGQCGDYVLDEGSDGGGAWFRRTRRISITLRWLLPGADVVGDE